MALPFDTTSAAYNRGLSDGNPKSKSGTFAPKNMHEIEIATACTSWREALSNHAHTSYYGVDYIRLMRAYWLGRCRAMRRVRGYNGA